MLSCLYGGVKPWARRADPLRPASARWPAAENSLGEQEVVSSEGHRDGRSVTRTFQEPLVADPADDHPYRPALAMPAICPPGYAEPASTEDADLAEGGARWAPAVCSGDAAPTQPVAA